MSTHGVAISQKICYWFVQGNKKPAEAVCLAGCGRIVDNAVQNGMIPRYASNPSKAVEVILWLAESCRGIDVYHLVKAAFFADKRHITEFGRPITGDSYEAAAYGPLAQTVYGLLRHDPIEMLAIGNNGPLPFRVDDAFRVFSDRGANMRRLSQSDIEALSFGLTHVEGRSFDELVEETHDDPAYRNARGLLMDWRDFIPEDDPLREEKRLDIAETASFVTV